MQTTHASPPPALFAVLSQSACTQAKPVYLAVSVNPHTQVLQVSCSFVPAPGAPATVAEALALDLVNAAHKRGATVVLPECTAQAGFVRRTLEAIINMQTLSAAESAWVAVSDCLPPLNTEVLIAFRDETLPATGQYTGCTRDPGGWSYPSEIDTEYCGPVTHWMSLPPHPTQGFYGFSSATEVVPT